MSAFRLEGPRFYAWDPSTGDPLVGGKVYLFEKGTTTPMTTWADQDKLAPNAHPVILNAAGEAAIFFEGDAKVRLDDANDVTIWTQDGVSSPIDALTVQSMIDAAIQDILPVYATIAALQTALVPSGVERVRVLGYNSVYDAGGAEYIRVASAPAHQLRVRSTDRYLPGGAEDSTNGGWWAIGEQGYTPLVAGAVGDGVTDDSAAIDRVNDATAPSVHVELEGRTYEYNGTFAQDPAIVFTNGIIVDDTTTYNFFPLLDVTEGAFIDITTPSAGVRQIAADIAAISAALLPANPNDGTKYVLTELDDVLAWEVLATEVQTVQSSAKPFARLETSVGDEVTNIKWKNRFLIFAFVDQVFNFNGGSTVDGRIINAIHEIDQTDGSESTPTFPFTIPAGRQYILEHTEYNTESGGGGGP